MILEQFPVGETILTPVGENCEATVCIAETRVDFALLETGNKKMRYIINNKPQPWHAEVSWLTFMPYSGFFYNFRDAERSSYVFNGQENPAQNRMAYDVTVDGKALCVAQKETGGRVTCIGETETSFQLDGDLSLTHDNKGFIYQAVDNYKNRNYQVVRKGKILFNGLADKIRISNDRQKYSWIGFTDDALGYPYLDSKKVNRPVDLFEPDTFAVSDCCTRYLFGERESLDGPVILVVDGKQTNIRCDECFDNESCIFSDDAASYCFVCTINGKHVVVRDDKIIAHHDEVFDTVFIGNDLFYVGFDREQDMCTLFRNTEVLTQWPYIEQYTAMVRDDGRQYCFFAHKHGLKGQPQHWHFVVNGKSVWTFDALPKRDCGYFHPEIYPVQFMDNSVYCIAIKNDNLALYHHRLAE